MIFPSLFHKYIYKDLFPEFIPQLYSLTLYCIALGIKAELGWEVFPDIRSIFRPASGILPPIVAVSLTSSFARLIIRRSDGFRTSYGKAHNFCPIPTKRDLFDKIGNMDKIRLFKKRLNHAA